MPPVRNYNHQTFSDRIGGDKRSCAGTITATSPVTAALVGTTQDRATRWAGQRLAAVVIAAAAAYARWRARQRLAAITVGTPTTLTRWRARWRLTAVGARTAEHSVTSARLAVLLARAVAFGRDRVSGDDHQDDRHAKFPCRHRSRPPCLCLCSRQVRSRRNGKTAIPRRFVRSPLVTAIGRLKTIVNLRLAIEPQKLASFALIPQEGPRFHPNACDVFKPRRIRYELATETADSL